ncbi:MAG: exodeoxyribonuclease VII small subunit [Chloroflexi bacterium]|nr:exodeoxyribonuclease VII small subunit [Chloroflexota bacterium]
MPKKSPPSPSPDLTFEQAFAELEKIVAQLEQGSLSLDDSLALFERGQALAAQCAELLNAAELKIKQLSPEGELADFDPEEDSA